MYELKDENGSTGAKVSPRKILGVTEKCSPLASTSTSPYYAGITLATKLKSQQSKQSARYVLKNAVGEGTVTI